MKAQGWLWSGVCCAVALWSAAAQGQEPPTAQRLARAALVARARVGLIPTLDVARRQEAERDARLLEAALARELARPREAPAVVAVAPPTPPPLTPAREEARVKLYAALHAPLPATSPPVAPPVEPPVAPVIEPTPVGVLALEPPRPDQAGLLEQKGALHPPLLYGDVRVSFGTTKSLHSKTQVRHTGWTMTGPSGHRVRNIAQGQVVYAGALRGYGLTVVVEHRGEYHSVYAHLRTLLVKVGQEVKPGDPLGVLGATGTLGGERLYFELRHQGRPLDPEGWFAPPGRFR